ncbi:hypothetical protein BS78_04G093600 [Paspalum vaginatum]|nr:hypothetical protein BS78_04G093600 [Paspalum vaginatum]
MALGVRVKLCLDGILGHAWAADIVVRVISTRCAQETIETNLHNPDETKTVDLWPPFQFTSQARDEKFGVIVHLEEIHDYSMASRDEKGNFTPGVRRLPRWNLGACLDPAVRSRSSRTTRLLLGSSTMNERGMATGGATRSSSVPVREEGGTGISGLFCRPSPPMLQAPTPAPTKVLAPPAPCKRRRRSFNMSSVRRSARLAAARPMTQLQRAQKNLCRKLGLVNDEQEPVESVLQEFIAMFSGPLPADIIAALTEIFNLDNEDICATDEALLKLAGEGVDDLAGEEVQAAA